jgi:predicted N-acetyltransferase YhbS
MDQIGYITRKATPAEAPEIRAMQERSMRALGTKIYSREAVERFIEIVSTMDDAIIAEGHFFVATTPEGKIIASAGWSQNVPPFDLHKNESLEDRSHDLAVVRSVFVEPTFSRRGVASMLMRVAEWDAVFHEVERLRLTSTLPGMPLYKRLGYKPVSAGTLDLGDGQGFAFVKMEKQLPAIYREVDLDVA